MLGLLSLYFRLAFKRFVVKKGVVVALVVNLSRVEGVAQADRLLRNAFFSFYLSLDSERPVLLLIRRRLSMGGG